MTSKIIKYDIGKNSSPRNSCAMIPYSTVQPKEAGKVFFILFTLTGINRLVLNIGIFVSLGSVNRVSQKKTDLFKHSS